MHHRRRRFPVHCIHSKIIKPDLLSFQIHRVEAVFQQLLRHLRTLERIRPGENHHFLGHESLAQPDQRLERRSTGLASRAMDTHPHLVFARLFEINAPEIGHAIGAHVMGRIRDLIKQLLLACCGR